MKMPLGFSALLCLAEPNGACWDQLASARRVCFCRGVSRVDGVGVFGRPTGNREKRMGGARILIPALTELVSGAKGKGLRRWIGS